VRIDLFLKSARLIKRRTIIRELCDQGRVLVNGREAKPAKEVRPGDRIALKYSSRVVELEVLGMPGPAPKKTPPEELYRVTAETQLPKEKDLWNENPSSS
jgi:ribosomal 50S subunit-recycling heat shock protein